MHEPALWVGGVTAGAMLVGAGVLHVIPRLGGPGRALAAWLCRAPGLDLLVTYFTVAPMIAGTWYAGWRGLLAAVVAMIASVVLWGWLHELAHPSARKGPRIVHTLNRHVGRFQNHAAVWWTAWAVPLFWAVRVAQYFIYPPLIWLVKLPRYRQGEWINVSRQKFQGLVGHDLIWCLYCDWMTGVWSLGTEMLRNVESFWCPIRFGSPEKCANCAIDFPDIHAGWAPSDGTMADVTRVLDEHYDPARNAARDNAWFGHPVRLTIKGEQR
jgi:hypothetical protein